MVPSRSAGRRRRHAILQSNRMNTGTDVRVRTGALGPVGGKACGIHAVAPAKAGAHGAAALAFPMGPRLRGDDGNIYRVKLGSFLRFFWKSCEINGFRQWNYALPPPSFPRARESSGYLHRSHSAGKNDAFGIKGVPAFARTTG